MGGRFSRPEPAQVGVHQLNALDGRLAAVLRSGAIKLIRADYLRDENSEAALPTIVRRQDLESVERRRGIRIFLSPKEAVAALRASNRSLGALTYGWCSPDHPDVTGEYLAAVRRFLRSPLGAHLKALFWDFPSLPQKPRSGVESQLFGAALKVMGDVYASALGTTVLRHREIPARPADLDGEVVVLVEPGGVLDGVGGEAELYRKLGPLENPRHEDSRWRVRFASHAAAEALAEAMAAGEMKLPGAAAVFCFYNGRSYEGRGWTTEDRTPALLQHRRRRECNRSIFRLAECVQVDDV